MDSQNVQPLQISISVSLKSFSLPIKDIAFIAACDDLHSKLGLYTYEWIITNIVTKATKRILQKNTNALNLSESLSEFLKEGRYECTTHVTSSFPPEHNGSKGCFSAKFEVYPGMA